VDKRTFIKTACIGVAGIFALGFTSKIKAVKRREKWDGIFRMPELPYSFYALEPFIDAETLRNHFGNIHGAYTENLNRAVKQEGLTGKTALEMLKEVSGYPASIRENGGGFFNHKMFWRSLAPSSGKKPSVALSSALNRDFGSHETFREEFGKAAGSVYGSGWVWLIYSNGRLKVTTTMNQDSPIMDVAVERGLPLLCLDVCDHAVPMNQQSQKSAYIDAFWKVADWDFASRRYDLITRNKIKL
jgi:Fe-Mn family superoxide dismutase